MNLNKLKNIFDHQAKSINKAAIILAATSFLSALLGLLRDRLLAGRFGAGDELDIYYTAFRIPDFLTMVLVMGAISAAITPIFSQHLVRSNKEAWKFLANLLNLFLFILIIVSLILIIFVPQLIGLIAPGFSGEKKELTILLTRIMFLSPFLLGIGNILSSVLCVFRRFLIASFTPIVYNLGIIFGILFFVPIMGLKGLAWGVVLGGILYVLIQLPILFKIGFSPQRILNFKDESFRKVVRLSIPRSVGLAASQINLVVMTAIASKLASGNIAIFNLADNLSRPLLTFVGISFSTAAFPSLALAFSKKSKDKFFQIFSETFSKIIYFILPLSLLLFILRDLVVKIILKVGKFGLIDTHLTAACLGMFALGLFAQSLVLLIAKVFYAVQNTKIPAIASIITMIFNIPLALFFVRFFSFQNSIQAIFIKIFNLQNLENISIIGLPLAFSISATIQFLILLAIFYQKKKQFFSSSI
jgi:putative peptidoglycan lipid II flippase